MKLRASLLAAACALALAACGGDPTPPAADTAAPPAASSADAGAASTDPEKVEPASVPEAPMGQVPADGSAPESGDTGDTAGDGGGTDGADVHPDAAAPDAEASAASDDGGEAAATGCSVDIEGNDQMKFNLSSITVPSSCSEFTIKLVHTGRLPVAAMGHNVVITSAADMAGVAADGISAGASAGYLKAGDSRVIAATDMVGGGGTSSVTFDVAKISSGGPYQFFCSFPGHAALMKGSISVD